MGQPTKTNAKKLLSSSRVPSRHRKLRIRSRWKIWWKNSVSQSQSTQSTSTSKSMGTTGCWAIVWRKKNKAKISKSKLRTQTSEGTTCPSRTSSSLGKTTLNCPVPRSSRSTRTSLKWRRSRNSSTMAGQTMMPLLLDWPKEGHKSKQWSLIMACCSRHT